MSDLCTAASIARDVAIHLTEGYGDELVVDETNTDPRFVLPGSIYVAGHLASEPGSVVVFVVTITGLIAG
jgi:hypothetical protein